MISVHFLKEEIIINLNSAQKGKEVDKDHDMKEITPEENMEPSKEHVPSDSRSKMAFDLDLNIQQENFPL